MKSFKRSASRTKQSASDSLTGGGTVCLTPSTTDWMVWGGGEDDGGGWQTGELQRINHVVKQGESVTLRKRLCVRVSLGVPRSALLVLHHVSLNGISLLLKLISIPNAPPAWPHVPARQPGTFWADRIETDSPGIGIRLNIIFRQGLRARYAVKDAPKNLLWSSLSDPGRLNHPDAKHRATIDCVLEAITGRSHRRSPERLLPLRFLRLVQHIYNYTC